MSIPAKDRFLKTNLRKDLCAENDFDNLQNFTYDSKSFTILGKSEKTDLFEKDEKRTGLFQIIACDEDGYLYESLIQNRDGNMVMVAMKTLPPPTGKKVKKDKEKEKLAEQLVQESDGEQLPF